MVGIGRGGGRRGGKKPMLWSAISLPDGADIDYETYPGDGGVAVGSFRGIGVSIEIGIGSAYLCATLLSNHPLVLECSLTGGSCGELVHDSHPLQLAIPNFDSPMQSSSPGHFPSSSPVRRGPVPVQKHGSP